MRLSLLWFTPVVQEQQVTSSLALMLCFELAAYHFSWEVANRLL